MRVEEIEANCEWINGLKDRAGRAKIQVRVDRMVHGNQSSHRNLIDGDKSTQQSDIKMAIQLARNFQE